MNGVFSFEINEVYGIPVVSSSVETSDAPHGEAARALACCINEIGRVDLCWMAESSGLSVEDLTTALEGIIFQDPVAYDLSCSEEDGWILRGQYGSVIPMEIRRSLRIREVDPLHTTLTPIDRFYWAIHSFTQRITAE